MSEELLNEVFEAFSFEGVLKKKKPYGSGHINDTFLLTFDIERMGMIDIILQRMNTAVFTKPIELMENIANVTRFLRDKIIASEGDPERETLNIIYTLDHKPYYVDSAGGYWRAYKFITCATSYDQVESAEDFYQSALAFGHFQSLLADYPAATLHETIKGFHDTKARFERFKEVVANDICNRAKDVQAEIEFVLAREDVANVLTNCNLPIRVTHNDTKLNNILFDSKSGKGLCIIDLDTIMPGLAANDFGDSIRFGAATAAEDEKNLDLVHFDLSLYELYVKGYLEETKDVLTKEEIESLPWGARLMTLECGIRFLTDYLQGDTYFKTDYPEHNLVRARTQFRLVDEMEQCFEKMREIVRKYA